MQSKETIMKMFEMRLEGMSLEEIGQHYGLTRQRVYQILSFETKLRGRHITKCVFPGITNWLREQSMTIKQFSAVVGKCTYHTMHEKLNGKYAFTLPEIKAIMSCTGMTFDEAFGEEIKPTENASNDVKDDA